MIYFIVLIVILIPAIRYDFLLKKGGEEIWYYVNLIVLILLAGLRYRVGGDTGLYMQAFERLPTLSELSTFKFMNNYYMPLWYVYTAIFKSFGGYFLFQMVQAIIVNTTFLWFFRKKCSRYFTAIVVYFVSYYLCLNMDILRQAICVCIFLLSYVLLEKKKLVWYYLMSIVAIGFHMSAIFLLIVPLVLIPRKEFIIIGIALLSLIFVIRMNNFENVVVFVSERNFSVWKYYIIDRLNYYINDSRLNIIGMMVRFLLCVPFLIVLTVKWCIWKKEDSLVDNMMLLLLFIQVSSIMFPMLGRFNQFLFPIGIVFLIKEISDNYEAIMSCKIAKLLVTIALFVYFFNISYGYVMNQYDYMEGARVYHRYVPYHSVFNPVKDDFREDYLRNVHQK